MKRMLGSWFHRHANSPLRRCYFWLLRRLFGVFGKRQGVLFVDINGYRYKRVVFKDTLQASSVQTNLMTFSDAGLFPKLIDRYENELLLEFVEGESFDPEQASHRAGFVGLMQALYTRDRDQATVDSDQWLLQLNTDLDFLVRCGVLESDRHHALMQAVLPLVPDTLVLGWDYMDPVSKNFVFHDDRLMAIDVESIASREPIGTGLVAASLHWLSDDGLGKLVSEFDQAPADLLRQLPFLTIAYPVGWCKRKILQGKHNFLPKAGLETRVELAQQLADYASNH